MNKLHSINKKELSTADVWASYGEQITTLKMQQRIVRIVTAIENNMHCFERVANQRQDGPGWMDGKVEVDRLVDKVNRVKKMFEIKE